MSVLAAVAAPAIPALVVQEFPLGPALPSALTAWLGQHQPDPIFATPDWFHQLADFNRESHHTSCNSEYVWLFVFRDAAPILAVPIEKRRGRLGQLHLKLLGNFYTPAIELFVDLAQLPIEHTWPCLFQAVDQHFPSWLTFWVAPLATAQQVRLQTASVESGCAVFPQRTSSNHTVHIDGLENYWANRPSRLLNTLKRKRKQLAKVAHQLEVLTAPNDAQVASYWKVYQKSWKRQEPSRSFIDWLIKWSARRGYLRLGLLTIEAEAVACQLWLIIDNKASIFKLAQDANADSFSPGSILTEYMINSLSASDHITHIDFLLGDDEFKPLWMDRNEPIFGVEVVNRKRLGGLLLTYFYRAKRHLRALLRRSSELAPLRAARDE